MANSFWRPNHLRPANRIASYAGGLALFKVHFGLLLALTTCLTLAVAGPETLVGTRPPEWTVKNWMNSQPMQLKDLRGKVVLIRWWTAPDCPYCRASAPALNEFYKQFHSRGLEVIGFYHHKSDEPLQLRQVKKYSKAFGFEFPLATDEDWKTLKRWWLDDRSRAWTSVSFLIDREGKIRYVHPGGQYVKGDADYAELRSRIEELLGPESALPRR